MCIKIHGICQVPVEPEPADRKKNNRKKNAPHNFREGHLEEEWGE